MNILVFNGSPKKQRSDTLHLSRAFLDGMCEAAPQEIHAIDVIDRHIEFCRGCFACKYNGSHWYCQELCANTTASLMKLVRRRPNRPRACSAWLPGSGPPVVRQGWRSHLRSP